MGAPTLTKFVLEIWSRDAQSEGYLVWLGGGGAGARLASEPPGSSRSTFVDLEGEPPAWKMQTRAQLLIGGTLEGTRVKSVGVFYVLQYGSISQMLRACAYGTPGIVSDVFNISEVFQCHKSACQGLMSS